MLKKKKDIKSIFSQNHSSHKSLGFQIFAVIQFLFFLLSITSCKGYKNLDRNLPSYRLFLNYMVYVEEILEKDFVRRNSANTKTEIDETFIRDLTKLKKAMLEVNPKAMNFKDVISDIPQEEKVLFFREYNRIKVQIAMLTKQLERVGHSQFQPMYQNIIPENMDEADLDY